MERETPLKPGDPWPDLQGVMATGKTESLSALRAQESPLVVYFMRTATCPVCHQHVRHLERLAQRTPHASIVIIVPGDQEQARDVEHRHPQLTGRIMASTSAHQEVGLFVRAGLQQSGTFVVQQSTVNYVRAAHIPLGSFDAKETATAIDGH